MDIGSYGKYPANALSNFAGHRFIIDGIQCNSMEGFLQSLKFKNPEMQKYVCSLIGRKAKFKGKRKKWWKTQTLHWLDKKIFRHSSEYQKLIDRAYECMFNQSLSFRKALKASGKAIFTHSISKRDMNRTILTEREFCSRLQKLKEKEIKIYES